MAAPAGAAPVDDFAAAAAVFARSARAAAPRAYAAAGRRREAARRCLDVFRATPPPNRDALYEAYFLDAALGAVGVDSPVFERFLGRLERIPLRREPALMAARRILSGQINGIEAFALSFDDACTIATEWQAANWRTPPRSIRLQRDVQHLSDALPLETDAAERRLRRAGHPRAATILDTGLDAGLQEERIVPAGDPVRCALMPDDCAGDG